MFKALKNWLFGGPGSGTKERELAEANAAPYKIEPPTIPVPVAESPIVVAEKPAEVKKEEAPKKPRKPRAPRAETVLIDDVKPKKPRAPRTAKTTK